jgi:hypothetical protein
MQTRGLFDRFLLSVKITVASPSVQSSQLHLYHDPKHTSAIMLVTISFLEALLPVSLLLHRFSCRGLAEFRLLRRLESAYARAFSCDFERFAFSASPCRAELLNDLSLLTLALAFGNVQPLQHPVAAAPSINLTKMNFADHSALPASRLGSIAQLFIPHHRSVAVPAYLYFEGFQQVSFRPFGLLLANWAHF